MNACCYQVWIAHVSCTFIGLGHGVTIYYTIVADLFFLNMTRSLFTIYEVWCTDFYINCTLLLQ